eukprot:CAMPEP_0184479602 /NCGR_PEP_ID=MMETSP0113_2-20130426/1265_1 /TAXON_ID=91329 /ORGANISM="Norrisiella sphaerica, Strain BC52" /LENGTH=285 /DNA_ID=CAMNT_0026857723 /DNA_START=291 /DNA_END=1148 /DNA_ORIENTATION=-
MKMIKEIGKKEHWWVPESEVQLTSAKPKLGTSSMVYNARWRNLDIIVKVAKDRKRTMYLKELMSELKVWKTVRHPNITTFLAASFREDLGLMLLVEEMSGGTLENFLNTRHSISDRLNWHTAMDIGSALAFLHSCKPPIIHGDLNPNNILFNSFGQAKIADFGLSRFTNDTENEKSSLLSELRYEAPEILLLRQRTRESDVYAYGMILLDLFEPMKIRSTRKKTGVNYIEIAQSGKSPNTSFVKNVKARELIAQCIHVDPRKRTPAINLVVEIEKAGTKEKCTLI